MDGGECMQMNGRMRGKWFEGEVARHGVESQGFFMVLYELRCWM